ncbi:MAG: CPBP family intramembrane glutamic endopeptidase [Terracidiphilus sp.]|jgi:membrane protease YdiL (CAAX protease family)
MTTASEQLKSGQAKLLATCGLAAVIVLPLLPVGRWIAPGDSLTALLIREMVWWIYAAALLLWLVLIERLPLSSIGFRWPTWKTLLFAVVGAVAMLIIFALHMGVIVRVFRLDTARILEQQRMIFSRPYWFRVLLVTRAAVVEEILFRGYMIEKVRQLTGSGVSAVAVSVLTFTWAHYAGWGLVQLIPACGAGVVLALLYVRRRDLPSNMLAHFLTDGVGFLLR